MPSDSSDTQATVYRLRHQIDSLTQQQTEALKTAIYVGMSPAEVKAYDDRHGEILQLTQQLAEFEKSL
ncbi:MAG TPA: hypothetical protein VMB66_12155 [Candidatus Acidoferrales bacterium]|nr:hypothetical protein [Candidatus Acidoferrales bacterium]